MTPHGNPLRPIWQRVRRTFQFLLPRALREREQQFHLLLDGIADFAIFMLDSRGCVTSWSVAADKIFGYSEREIRGRHVSCLYVPEEASAQIPHQELTIAAVHGRFENVGWRLRSDGSRFWANSVLCPVWGPGGRLKGFSIVTRDITERRKAEEALRERENELQQARKMEAIGRLAGGVAHDFNNLITGIMGLTQDVHDSLPIKDPRRDDLKDVLMAASRAVTLTRQLLAFGRRQVSSPQVINVNSTIKDLGKILDRMVGADVEIATDLADDIGAIQVDPSHMEQVLINLIMNARDAMPQGGRITIQTRRAPGPSVCLSVTDTGTGIDQETMIHLFEPFFTTKEQGRGTGLGLATVYGIIKQNGGDILVESNLGKGSTFRILLPELQGGHPVKVSPVATSPKETFGTETVLIAEDEDIVRHVALRALQRRGYVVLTASSGEEALEICQRHQGPIHLLLTDIVMPRMNGSALAEEVRRFRPEAAILYMSGYSKDIIAHRNMLEQGFSFIEKSFTAESLAQKVREVLTAYQASASDRAPISS